MSITAAEFRAQVEALDTPAIENCIQQLVARSSTTTRAGICFNCFNLDTLSNSQRVQIAREVLAERTARAALMVASAFKTEAEEKAEEAFEAMLDGFEPEVESEDIAARAQAARELAAEEDATVQLRRAWEWGMDAALAAGDVPALQALVPRLSEREARALIYHTGSQRQASAKGCKHYGAQEWPNVVPVVVLLATVAVRRAALALLRPEVSEVDARMVLQESIGAELEAGEFWRFPVSRVCSEDLRLADWLTFEEAA